MKAPILFALIVAWSLSAGAQEPPRRIPDDPASAIGAQFDRWIGAFEACDARTLAYLFTPEGVYAANTGQVLVGREAIRRGVQGWMSGPLAPACRNAGRDAGSRLDVEHRTVRLDVMDGAAYSLTRFTIRVAPIDCEIDAGHVLGVWSRQPSGEWLLEALAGNKDPTRPLTPCPSGNEQ